MKFFGAAVLRDILRMEISQNLHTFTVCAVVIHTLQGSPHYAVVHVQSDKSFTVVDSAYTPGLLACKDVASLLELVTERLMYPTSILFFRRNSATTRSAGSTSVSAEQPDSSSGKLPGGDPPPPPNFFTCAFNVL